LRKEANGILLYDNFINEHHNERILVVSDSHIPFHIPLGCLSNYAGIVDTLVYNGDLMDTHSASSFPSKFRVDYFDELVIARQYLIDIVKMIAPKRVIVTKGNHEVRLSRYLADKLSDDIACTINDDPLDMIINDGFTVRDIRNKTKTEYSPISESFNIPIQYDGNWYAMYKNIIFAHPLSYSKGMLKTTEKALDYFLRAEHGTPFQAIVLGHSHKLGSYTQSGIKLYECGCLCDLDQLDYNNGKLVAPNQNGFLYICLDENDKIIDEKTKLVSF